MLSNIVSSTLPPRERAAHIAKALSCSDSATKFELPLSDCQSKVHEQFVQERHDLEGICDVRMISVMQANEFFAANAKDPIVVKEKCGGIYGNRTPEEYLDHVLSDKQEMQKIERVAPMTLTDTRRLLGAWQRGLIKFRDNEKDEWISVATHGFVFDDAEVAIVSMPGKHYTLFSSLMRICLEDTISFCIVWKTDWGSLWFYVWLRNVAEAAARGQKLLVLTSYDKNVRTNGTWDFDPRVGVAQSAEICKLRRLGLPFVCIDLDRFIMQRRSHLNAARTEEWDMLMKILRSPPGKYFHGYAYWVHSSCSLDCSLRKTDYEGCPALIAAVGKNAPTEVVRELLKAADVLNCTGSGFTALHRAVKWCGTDVIRMLLEHPSCNINARSFRKSMTPLDMSKKYKKDKIMELLLEYGALEFDD